MRGLWFALIAAISVAQPVLAQILPFDDLRGWHDDKHDQALAVFLNSCDKLPAPEWQPICKFAQQAATDSKSAKAFFEMMFRPLQLGTPPALFTGYFEPELKGARRQGGRFQYPIYARPKDLVDGAPYLDRAAIEGGALRGRGLELAWLDDPVDVFFLHIQGSGRIILPNGAVMRVGYAGRNGYEYRSIGQELVRQGVLQENELSAAAIQSYVRRNPANGARVLNANPSYIFFREIKDLDKDKGPIGAMSLPITAHRSVAVDPAYVPLGAPVWLEKEGAAPINRLMIAQDTGGAIKGAQRADIFFGTGKEAGLAAGNLRDAGRMVQLLPIDLAYSLASGQ
jgi:membrane-bound lytic murein transglycosylase A